MYLKIEHEAVEPIAAIEEIQNPANLETDDEVNDLDGTSRDDEQKV